MTTIRLHKKAVRVQALACLALLLACWITPLAWADYTPEQLLTIHKNYVSQTASEMEQATLESDSFSYYFTSIGLMGMLSAVEAETVMDPAQADAEMKQVMHYIDNMISRAVAVTDTDAMGIARTRNVWPPISNKRPDELDSYQGAEPIARAAAIILKTPAFKSKYQAKAKSYIDFVDQSIVQRWYVDLYNGVIPWLNEDPANWDSWPLWNDKSWLLGDIVSSLYQATGKPLYKNILGRIANGFRAKLSPYKTGITWDSGAIPIGSDTTEGGPATSSDVGNQDGSWDTDHSNRAPMMMVFQYEAGLGGWTNGDISRLAATLSDLMWNQSASNPMVSNYIDGSNKSYRNHFTAGENGFIFAGWALLGRYSAKAQTVGTSMLNAVQQNVNNASASENSDAYYKLLGLSGHVLRSAVLRPVTATQNASLAAPLGVVAIPGNSQVTVRWNPVPGATSYNLYRSRFPNVNKSNGFQIRNVRSPMINKNFANGTNYYMVVTAVNADGESSDSSMVSAAPNALLSGNGSSVPQDDLSSIRIFPNPWRKDRDSGQPVTFDHLTMESKVEIFTVAGQLVTTLPTSDALTSWNLTNDSGEKVASGLYVCLVTNKQGQKKRDILSVIQ